MTQITGKVQFLEVTERTGGSVSQIVGCRLSQPTVPCQVEFPDMEKDSSKAGATM